MPSLPAVTASLTDQLHALERGAGVRSTNDGVIVVRGADRIDWISGMVTNEVKSLTAGKTRYAALVHEKGKLLADVWIAVREADALLIVPGDTVANLLEHFERHIIMEDVEVARLDAKVVAVVGAAANTVFPPDARTVFATERLARPGVDIVCGAEEIERIAASVASGAAVMVSDEGWNAARIGASVPQWGIDFGPENYVQEADITRRAVSFNKGCYCGQEVVCRLEMRGPVRRQLIGLRAAGEPIAVGTQFGEAGVVTSSAPALEGGESAAIAMVKWDVASTASTVDVGGREARVVKLGAS